MRVFHFCGKDHAISNIQNSQIKIALINELNDPFEFYVNFKDKGSLLDHQATEDVKNHYNTTLGLICFSEQMNSPVQWAHYADNHKGICLEFEVPENLLVKVKYKNEPVTIDSSDGDWKSQFIIATISKYKHWNYEEERRLIIPLDSNDIAHRDKHLFMPFSDNLSPIRAHIGLKCDLSELELKTLKDYGLDVMNTVKSRTSYSIINTKG